MKDGYRESGRYIGISNCYIIIHGYACKARLLFLKLWNLWMDSNGWIKFQINMKHRWTWS